MRSFEYVTATGLGQAIGLLDGDDAATRLLAGGTDLLPLMKLDLVRPRRVVDLKSVAEIASGIDASASGVSIGALTTLAALESSSLLRDGYTALAEAASSAATPQIRNRATLGGNLLQRPRCWYYRSSQFHCWLKGGDTCHARDGQNQLHAVYGDSPCVAVHPSDPAAALLVLGAEVEVSTGANSRRLSMSDFYTLPSEDHRLESTLQPDEVLTRISLPALDDVRSTYRKAMNRKVWAFALVGVAAALRLDGGRAHDVRLVLSGVAPIPWRVAAAERTLEDAALDDNAIARAAEVALAEARPLGLNGYKVPLARGLIQQALRELRSG